jgi:hypothetical protein
MNLSTTDRATLLGLNTSLRMLQIDFDRKRGPGDRLFEAALGDYRARCDAARAIGHPAVKKIHHLLEAAPTPESLGWLSRAIGHLTARSYAHPGGAVAQALRPAGA